jgi:hypothetical protein
MMLKELQTLERFNGLFLGSNINTHTPLMMAQELQTLDRLNWVFLGSNATHIYANDVPKAPYPRQAQWGTPRFKCKHT